MKSNCRTIEAVLFFVGFLLLCAGAAVGAQSNERQVRAGQNELLNRQVTNVYLEAGWMVDQLPEFFAQLEIGGGINFGLWPAEPNDRQPAHDRPPQPTRIEAFELESGTVREALDSLIKANPSLSWEKNGAQILIRRKPRSKLLETLLATQIGKVDLTSTASVENSGARAMGQGWATLRDHADAKLTSSLPEMASVNGMEQADLFFGRVSPSFQVWQQPKDQTFRQFLNGLAANSDSTFWYAIHGEGSDGYGNFFGSLKLAIALTSWSPVRRKLNTSELVRSMDEDYKKLHGYRTKEMRIEDARAELRRRHHFKPKELRQAMTKGTTITDLVSERTWNAYYHVDWLGSLGDSELSQIVFDRALDVKANKEGIHPLKAFDRPGFKDFDPALIPNWRKVMRNHPSQSMRQYARYVVALYEWYQAGGKNSGEPRPSRPGIF